MKQLADQRVLILGLGLQGLAMARWCARFGAHVTVWDSREDPPQRAALSDACPNVVLRSGALAEADAAGVHWLLKGPGLAQSDERIAALWKAAQAAGIRTGGELDLFVMALAELKAEQAYAPHILAITGTNGKTTTTALTTLMVQRAGRHAVAAGNIGPTLLETLAQSLDDVAAGAARKQARADVTEAAAAAAAQPDLEAEVAQPGESEPEEDDELIILPEVWVLELSSFQLADLGHQQSSGLSFDPAAAVVLNLTQDHLDWHGDMATYGRAKSRVFGPTSTLVVNRDDPAVAAMEPVPVTGKLPKGAVRPEPRRVIRFGLTAPQRAGDFGLLEEAGMAWLVRALPADETIKRRKGDEAEELHIQRLMPADALRLRGRHNASNALAALALATAIGCSLAPMLHGLREYRGEKHRVEFVARIGDVEAFDDTKGTNVGATVAALDKAKARTSAP
jgi:UDP-N-acetylmuramoylalanine--D-glutamate ligase